MAITIKPDSPNKITTTEDKKSVNITKDQKSIVVSNNTTSIVNVSAQGPQGQKGDTGATGAQGVQGISAFSGSAESSSISTRLSTAESELGNTLISSSAQIASDISGSFTSLSGSFSTRITATESELGNTLISSSAQISSDISGSFTSLSGSLSTRLTTDETNITNLQTDSGSFSTRLTTAEQELENTLVSSSAAIDHDQTTNFVANEHIDHSSVTLTAGDGLSGGGDITTNRSFAVDATVLRTTGNNVISSSAQISSDISGSFTNASSSFSTRITAAESELGNTLISSSAQISSDISGSFTSLSSSLSTRLTTDETNITNLQTDSGSFSTRITTEETNVDNLQTDSGSVSTRLTTLEGIDFISSSAQISSDISGSFTQPSSSFSTRVTTLETDLSTEKTNIDNLQTDSGSFSTRITTAETELSNTLISSSAQIASDISGSFTSVSSSFSTRISTNETELSNTLISSSAQIASDISGSFGNQRVGTTDDVDFASVTTTGNVSVGGNLDVSGTTTSIDSSTLNIGDKNITIGSGSTTSVQLDGGGIDIGLGGTIANLRYQHSTTSITSSVDFRAPNFYGIFQGALSSSAQIASNISGSFTAASSSFSTRITTAETELDNTLISSSAQISTDISGSFTAPSASFSTRITTAESELSNTLFSGSAQVDHDSTTNFVANEHIDHSSVSITAGNGLTGGGTIASTRTINVGAGDGISVAADSVAVDATVLRTTGDSVVSASAQITHDSTTGFVANEHIDHSGVTFTAGTGLTGGGTIAASRTFNVVGGDGITANADDIAVDATVLRTNSGVFSGSAQITHDSTTGFVANEHIDHSSVSITAGSGLTGGGTIAASRTINIGAGTGIDVAADAISVDVSDFMSNGVNDRVLTATGTDAFNAESNLTFDGNVLVVPHISASGNISGSEGRFSGDVIAFYSSDKRLKDNIIPISNPIEKIKSIGGYEFDWNDNQSTYEGHDIGVIAQEIEDVLPELVTTRNTGYKAVKYEKIIALLIEAVKEQQKQIDELRNKS